MTRFFIEGPAKFEKEGYLEQADGSHVKQPEAFVSVPIKGTQLEASFDMFTMPECFNEKTFSNTPCIVIDSNVRNYTSQQKMYYGYKVVLLDQNKKAVGSLVETNAVAAGIGAGSNSYINLSPRQIAQARFYRIAFYESAGIITKEMINTNRAQVKK